MCQKISVLIPDGESVYAQYAADCLAEVPGVSLHVLSSDKRAPLRLSTYRKSFTCNFPVKRQDARLEEIARIVTREKVDVILPVDTAGIGFAIANRQALAGLAALVPLPEQAAFDIANNKAFMATFLKENNLPGPASLLVEPGGDFEKQAREFTFPVLLKPVTSGGGRGIKRFDSLPDLLLAVQQLGAAAGQGKYLLQSLVPGHVIGLNFLCRDGEMLAETLQTDLIPNRQKWASAAAIQFIKDPVASSLARRLVSALRWSGFANVDTLCTATGELLILDINARCWGSLLGSCYAAGVNFPYLACLAGLGRSFPVPEYQLGRYFHPVTAIKETVRALIKHEHNAPSLLSESSLKLFALDPFAEAARVVKMKTERPDPQEG